ncbi:hypothetical protein ACHAXA_009056 [Cyclostephanos tholiformis]|uniref:Uncharacterized protein n=1 Tax=Cyclostephanos tholiformis TaxID=382380 RepID=A0ABD3R967_9STRA
MSSSAPGDAYLRRVEVRSYPPDPAVSTSAAASSTMSVEAASRVSDTASAWRGLGAIIHPAYHHQQGMSEMRRYCVLCGAFWGCVCVVVITLAIVGAMLLLDAFSGGGG